MRHITLAAFLLTLAVEAQYNGPESVEYDPVGDRYFVSNTLTNRIKVRSQDGTVTDFVITPAAPYGLEIMGGVLYACMGNGVRGYDLNTASEVYDRDLGALFPNGITTDGVHLYITDFHSNARRIYKVDPVGDDHSTLVAATGQQPNGIVWDPLGERLVVVFWGTNAPIKSYDRATGAESTLLGASGLSNIDGITMDCDGNFLVASWSPDAITRYAPSFSVPGSNLGIVGVTNPADIDFDMVNERICIPNTSLNTITLTDAPCTSTGMRSTERVVQRAVPNPASQQIRFDPPLHRTVLFEVLDIHGAVVRQGMLRPDEMLDVHVLEPGIYMVRTTGSSQQVRFVKE